jgi:hemolysin activation/secretion protein
MMNRSSVYLFCFLSLAIASAMTAAAQSPPDRATRGRPQQDDTHGREETSTPTIDRTPVLPRAEGLPDWGLAAIDRIRVNRIVFERGTILPSQEVAEMVGPYEGREVTIEELFALRQELSKLYLRHGYVNSGVVIPDQKVTDGVVIFREVLGTLTNINVVGNGHLSGGYIRNRIKSAAGKPLQIRDIQESLELLKQDPLIERINARLKPGMRPGEGELDVSLKMTRPFQVVIGADNRRSASTGGEQATLAVAHLNLLGQGDALSGEVGWSKGHAVGSMAYSYPLTERNTKIEASFSVDDAKIIEEPFDEIDIRSKTMRAGLFVSHPWIRTPRRLLVSSAGIERKHSESTLLGFPFSFSPGDREGKSDTTVVNAGVEWTERARTRVLALSGSLRFGVDAFHATISDEGPDGRFTAFLGQAQFAQSVKPLRGELLLRGMAQLAAAPLLGIEKLPIGGFNTVRGYREYQFVRDNGVAASIELRIPIRPARPPAARFDPLNLQVAPFVDYGRSWDKQGQALTADPVGIWGTGAGLMWSPIPGFRADIYWARPFKDVGNPGNDLQDKGIYFSVHYRVPL